MAQQHRRTICTTIRAVFVVCLINNFQVFHASAKPSETEPVSGEGSASVPRRQNTIPVLYVSGTHYQVGYSVGQTFGATIKDFISLYEPLQNEMLPLYKTQEGQRIYNESLKSAKKYFPQYVIELQGMADGAKVPFHELFLMALDDTLSRNMDTTTKDKGPVGCSSLIINQQDAQLLGHTEDALSETVNHYYIISAHVMPGPDEMSGIFPAREEKFEALTYAGHLPGYASGHNYHGLVFSINTIFVSKPLRGKIPREFITRALLATKADTNDILGVLTNEGTGTADAFNVNYAFLNEPRESRVFHTVEVTPSVNDLRSEVFISDFTMGSNSLHTNRLLHLEYPELNEEGFKSSLTREARYKEMTKNKVAASLQEMLEILGNRDDNPYPLFSDRADARVSTINLGVFDFDRKTWTMWTNDPLTSTPLLQLPLTFTDLISQVRSEVVVNSIAVVDPFNNQK